MVINTGVQGQRRAPRDRRGLPKGPYQLIRKFIVINTGVQVINTGVRRASRPPRPVESISINISINTQSISINTPIPYQLIRKFGQRGAPHDRRGLPNPGP